MPIIEGDAAPLGVYVHWPYCARICPYCDFNIYKNRSVDAARWRESLRRDLSYWAERTGKRPLRSLYFGGGTPSLAPLEIIEGVIDACASLWGFEPGAEITLEANPTDAEERRFADFKRAGINRLSLGAQSFDDAALKFLGRNHDGETARRAVETSLRLFDRLTFDLIYALPRQSAHDWRRALRDALAIGAGHLSLYQLTIEDGTAFAKAVERGAWTPPTDDLQANLYEIAQEETARAGLPAYEISNHARRGEESHHNLLYWTGGDYVGVGPGAHGRLSDGARRIASETLPSPEDYLAAVDDKSCGAMRIEPLDAEAAFTERLAMGLRLTDGIELRPAELAALKQRRDRLAALEADDLLHLDGAVLKASADGRRVLNAVLAALLA
ncbi:MAG TPA: radical SAM family heme chaperone HemW [Parvularculaceae bacterium]|nr:radical SAM family heme chaperone HemW [Parvularculaceae bacterium]